jgi:hypothetical protein
MQLSDFLHVCRMSSKANPILFFIGFFSFATAQTCTNLVDGDGREGAAFNSDELDEKCNKNNNFAKFESALR